jgi:hypothetical protein
MNSFFTLHSFLEVGKTQDLPSKFWQTLGDALMTDLEKQRTNKKIETNGLQIYARQTCSETMARWRVPKPRVTSRLSRRTTPPPPTSPSCMDEP